MSIKQKIYTKEDETSRMNTLLANNPTGELFKVLVDKYKVLHS